MVSRNKIKLIKSLDLPKYRKSHRLFIAEGNKIILDFLYSSVNIETIIALPGFLKEVGDQISPGTEVIETNKKYLQLASLLKTPQDALAICRIPDYDLSLVKPGTQLVLCLDSIQDPGNLGTIIRICDWFGISDVVCSAGTADAYNPKAIQASMGSVARVRVHYTDLTGFLKKASVETSFVAGTFLQGENIYSARLQKTGIIVMGNEGKGISSGVTPLIKQQLFIPHFNNNDFHAESLNVATATAIVCSEIMRR